MEWMDPGHLVRLEGRDDGQPLRARDASEEADEVAGCTVGGVQVVECEEDRVLLAQRRQDPQEALHDPGLPSLGRRRRASLRSMAEQSESGHEHRKQRAEFVDTRADDEVMVGIGVRGDDGRYAVYDLD